MSQSLYRLVETTPPAAEPLDLSDVKKVLLVDHSGDDTLIGNLISVARQFCEEVTGRSLINRTYSLYLDEWKEDELLLPKPPLVSVSQIKVYAENGTSSVFPSSGYFVDIAGTPGRIVLTQSSVPPLPARIANGIEIQFTAGYGAASSNIPPLLRQGMKQIIAHLYEHRGENYDQALLASGAAAIFKPYCLMRLS